MVLRCIVSTATALKCAIIIAWHLAGLLLNAGVGFVNRLRGKQILPAEPKSPKSPARKKRVAVIGGGIAGTSAAWTAARSGECTVKLFEARGILGGNAKTHVWDAAGKEGSVRTGLSVLAWPERYFRHYELLLKQLGIPVTTVQPKFTVSCDHVDAVYSQGERNERWQKDMRNWDRAVAFVRRVNKVCAWVTLRTKQAASALATGFGAFGDTRRRPARGSSPLAPDLEPSFYEVAMINPMNLISARRLTRTFFGVSDDFWNCVVVPVYSSSFLTAALDNLPALILPPLDDIISVGAAEPLKPLHTWQRTSKEVFDKLAAEIGDANIVLNANLQKVKLLGDVWEVVYAGGSKSEIFDAVIFACPSTAVDSLTEGTQLRDALFDSIIPHITYENQRDDNFVKGCIHTDRGALPSKLHTLFFDKNFTNYVRVIGDPRKGVLENTFVLGTWVPAALAARPPGAKDYIDAYVTYNAAPGNKCSDKQVGEVDNSWAHPQFTLTNLALAFLMPLLQGRHNAYYCACYTTPGNGHDLSLLSGIVMGSQVTSTKYYPFAEVADPQTRKDYDLLRNFLGF